MLNVSLSALLALALLGGIVFSLRTASREIRLSKMKSDFVSNVSHELRTPLASIRVFGEFLKLGRVKQDGKIREYGEYIETESRRLTQLINNILDFSKIESGAKSYAFEETDVGELLGEAVRTLQIGLRYKGFTLDYQGPGVAAPEIAADRDAIAQGSGLGLSIVNHIVEAHGGRVAVDSEPGRGSTFTIHLPVTGDRTARAPHGIGACDGPPEEV